MARTFRRECPPKKADIIVVLLLLSDPVSSDFERMKLVKDGEIKAVLEIKALEGACIWKLTARDEDTLASLQEMLNTASF
jgi:hypothetical protein